MARTFTSLRSVGLRTAFAGLMCGTLLLAPVPAVAQVLPPDAGSAEVSGAKIRFERMEIDFGEIPDTKQIHTTVKFTNEGTGLLTIDRIKSGCGCTAAELTVRDYLPGESGEIEIAYDPRNRSGKQNKSVTVTCNDPQKTFNIRVMSDITPAVTMEPRVVALGQIVHRSVESRDFEVISRREKFEIDKIEIDGPNLSAEVIGMETLELEDGGVEHHAKLRLTVDESAPKGWFSRLITLNTKISDDDDPEKLMEHGVAVTVSGSIVGDIQVVPPRVPMGTPGPGTVINKQVKIRSLKSFPFTILDIKIETDEDTQVSVEHEATTWDDGKSGYTLDIEVAVPGQPGPFRGYIIITTDRPEQDEVKFPFFGTVRNRPIVIDRDK